MKETLVIIFFVVGNLIGASFLQLPCEIAFLGNKLIISWTIGFIIAMIFSWIFGQLAVLKEDSNTLSDYFVDISMKKSIAFLYWNVVVIANMLFLDFGGFNCAFYSVVFAFLIMVFLSLLNHYLSYNTLLNIEIFISSLKFLILIFLPIFIYWSNPNLYQLNIYDNIGYKCIITQGLICFWSFLGIESVCVFGKGKKVRNGLLIGVIISFILYLVSSILVVGMLSLSEINNNNMPFTLLLLNAGYINSYKYINILSIFMCVGTMYGWIASTSKMALHFAKDELFSKKFLKETPSGTSFYGLWLSSFMTFIFYFLIKIPFISSSLHAQNTFNFTVNICLSMFFIIFGLCAYKLYDISNFWFDSLIGLIGMIIVVLALSVNFISSFFAINLFLLFYLYQRFSHKEKIS